MNKTLLLISILMIAVLAVSCEVPAPTADEGASELAMSEPEAEPAPALVQNPLAQSDATCSLDYHLPADLSISINQASQADLDQLSWQTFLALNAPEVGAQVNLKGDDNPTQWSKWSSTPDLLNPVKNGSDPTPFGTHYYPQECQSISGYRNYRVIDEVGKVDDAFLEAAKQALSPNPVVTPNGFLRYEILLSPATYDWIVQQKLYAEKTLDDMAITPTPSPQAVNFICGQASYTGGDPANEKMGALLLKVAWMEVTEDMAPDYHTEQLLVYTPAHSNSSGESTCELKTMGMVGMHIAHKTQKQPAWIWATFEHKNNAPDCTALPMGPGSKDKPKVRTDTCPATPPPPPLGGEYNFFPQKCSDDPGACAECNQVPADNGQGKCVNPDNPNLGHWCVDQPALDSAGLSKLCRQVPLSHYDQTMNQACGSALEGSLWGNYELISTQWVAQALSHNTCQNVALQIYPDPKHSISQALIRPQVALSDGTTRPWLANTSMESYERSNCLGCHSKTTVKEQNPNLSTDFIYFLGVEVPAAADN